MSALFIKLLLPILFLFFVDLRRCSSTMHNVTLTLFWTTTADTFHERNLAVLDSYLHFHPELSINVYAKDPNMYQKLRISDYQDRGYKFFFDLIDDSFLIKYASKCPYGEWLLEESHKKEKFYYSHLTDFLRFCLLYEKGGIYSDFDAVLINPLTMEILNYKGLTVGIDKIGQRETCSWCFGLNKKQYLAPGLLIAGSEKLQILSESLKYGFSPEYYQPHLFNRAGPWALNQAYKGLVSKLEVNPLPPLFFYPVNYEHIAWHFRNENYIASLYHDIRRESISLHLYGGTTKNITIEENSLVWRSLPIPILSNRSRITSEDCFISDYNYTSMLKCFALRSEKLTEIRIINGNKMKSYKGHQRHINEILSTFKVISQKSTKICIVSSNDLLCVPYYSLNQDLTIILKPFGRLEMVRKLIGSVREMYSDVKILIGNDGEVYNNFLHDDLNLEVVQFPYDLGLSDGRNKLINIHLKTQYFFMLDEDFLFVRGRSDLALFLHHFVVNNLDILAGKVFNDELDFIGKFKNSNLAHGVDRKTLWMLPAKRYSNNSIEIVDFVPNVFISKKSLIDKISWNPELKLGEHEDFFWRAKKLQLKVGTSNIVGFFHKQESSRNKKTYAQMRSRVFRFLSRAMETNRWEKIKLFGKNVIANNHENYRSSILFAEVCCDEVKVKFEFFFRSPIHGIEVTSKDPTLYGYVHDYESYKRQGVLFATKTFDYPLKFVKNIYFLRSLNHTSSSISPLQLLVDNIE